MSSAIRNARSLLDRLADISGRVITPTDPAYDQFRTTYYGGIDKRPAAIAIVADVADVRAVVATARDGNYELAIRGGGHSIAGHCATDGGIVIDLREMAEIEIDASARTAWVEGGATALDVTKAAAEYGLAVGFGDSGSVGVGGITVGGGIGFLVRKFGMTIDSLLAAEVVTADGRHVHADAEHDPELFWAIRGGGGNFGVVTRFKFRLHELPHFTGGMLILPATPETILGFAAASMAAPDGLSTIGNIMPAPPLPLLPAEMHGRLVIVGLIAFAGDDESAVRAIAPLRGLATPLADMVKPGPYGAMFQPEDPNSHPSMIVRTNFLSSLDVHSAETILEYLAKSDAAMRVMQLRVLGGAVASVPANATAFAHRSKAMLANVATSYNGTADRAVRAQWASEFAHALHPGDDAAYVGFMDDDEPSRIHGAYPGATWDRLTRIKAIYDPGNVFRLNQNIDASDRRGDSNAGSAPNA